MIGKSLFNNDWQLYNKIAVVLLAVIMACGSLLYTNYLVRKLYNEERVRMELWADAVYSIIDAEENCDISLAQKVIESNTTLPLALTDDSMRIISMRNVDTTKYKGEELAALIQEFRETNEPIQVDFPDGSKQYVCYGNSLLLNELSYFPFVQFAVVAFFFLCVLAVFLYMKQAEQNKVWVGLSKETAHQLGTPISSLMAWVELFQVKHPDDKMLPEMQKDVQRLRTIAERFSQIGSKMDLEAVEFAGEVSKSVAYMRTRLSKQIEITESYPNNCYVWMNVPLFEWVVENLCKNAADAMEGSGSIDLHAFVEGGRLCLDVSDTGKGIARKNLRKVFRPGFTTKKRGWGLGLSLVKRIVEEYHHGSIYVKQSEVGKGTTFRIELRIAD